MGWVLTEEQLKEVYGVIEQLNNPEKEIQQPSLMTKLQKLQIDAPQDFSLQVGMDLGREVSAG